jgi:epoxyqueuosine reductase QueG
MSMTEKGKLKAHLRRKGAGLVGVADLAPFGGWITLPEDLLAPYTHAVSLAVPLPDEPVDAIEERPTPEYARAYREANETLDRLAEDAVRWITKRGYKAEAVPASKILDDERLLGSLSHKALARMAGLGWQGKSLLIVTPKYGPRVRLATILTDMPLPPDGPVKNRCGTCTKCTEACPVHAIRNVSTEGRYETREDALVLADCNARTWENVKMPGIGYRICGVCVRACPWGKKKD